MSNATTNTRRRQRVPPEISSEVIRQYGNDCWLRLPGCTGKGTTSDHIVPYIVGGATTVPNLRRACRHCNTSRSDRVLSGYGAHIHVVLGPPEAGKTTWVREHATSDALVLDYDAVAEAIQTGSNQRGEYMHALATVVGGAWSGAYNRLIRLPDPVDVWIIKALPTVARNTHILADWIALNYDITIIDPGSSTVMERLAADHRSSQAEQTARQWYSLGLTQSHVDSLRALRAAQLRAAGLIESSSDESRPSW